MPGFVSGGYLDVSRREQSLTNTLVHVTDWYPTLLEMIGADGPDLSATSRRVFGDSAKEELEELVDEFAVPIDGRSVWRAIQFGEEDEDVSEIDINEREVLMDLNNEFCAFSSCGTLRSGRWKYLRGSNMVTNMEWGDGDQWQRKDLKDRECMEADAYALSLCDAEGYLEVSDDSLACQHSERGCLFEITTDACEYVNVASENEEIVDEMIRKLDGYAQRAVSALVTGANTLRFEEYDPNLVCDSTFWCPFEEYAQVEFEEVLREEYRERYGAEKEEMRLAMSMGVRAVDEAATIDSILFAVLALVLGVSLCFVLYVNVRHRNTVRGECLEAIELRSETAPLVD